MLREQERVIDHQVRAIEELDDKSEHMLRLSIAALAGALTLASFLLRGPGQVPPLVLLPFGSAAALNLCALVFLVDAYVGFRHHAEAHVGSDPAWVAERAGDPAWTLEQHMLTLIQDSPGFSAHNIQVMERATHRRRLGVYSLLVALVLYVVGYLYILSGVIV